MDHEPRVFGRYLQILGFNLSYLTQGEVGEAWAKSIRSRHNVENEKETAENGKLFLV